MQQAYAYGSNPNMWPNDRPPQEHSCSGSSKHGPSAATHPGMSSGMERGMPSEAHPAKYPQHTEGSYYRYGAAEYGYPSEMAPYQQASPAFAGGWLDFSNGCYLKGFAVGAVATLLLTNSTIQRALVKGVVTIWSAVQGGVEEVKETFHDVKAEMSMDKQ